jgi:hypothetical protein
VNRPPRMTWVTTARSLAGVAWDIRAGLFAYARIGVETARAGVRERLEWLAGSLDVDYPGDCCDDGWCETCDAEVLAEVEAAGDWVPCSLADDHFGPCDGETSA